MATEDSFSSLLWLESRVSLNKNPNSPSLFEYLPIQFNAAQTAEIARFINVNKLSWTEFAEIIFALCLHRLSTTEVICYGVANAIGTKKKIQIHEQTLPIISKINDKLSVKTYISSYRKQHKSAKKTATFSDEIKYLFLHGVKEKSRKFKILDAEKFRLALYTPKGAPRKFIIYFNPNYYHREDVLNIVEYYKCLAINFCENMSNKIIHVDYLPEHEKEVILNKWSGINRELLSPILKHCVHDLISEIAKSNPDKLAIKHHDVTLTFKQLDNASNHLARYLRMNDVQKNDNIAVLMERTPSLIITMLALYKLGAVFVPINPKYPMDRTEFVIEDSHAKKILANDLEKVPDKFANDVLLLSAEWQELPVTQQNEKLPPVSNEQIAYIIYTSGTTGKPKGVMIRHISLSNLAAWYQTCFEIVPEDRASQFASQGFDTYICETMPILALGASVHIVDDNIKLTPSQFFDWMTSERITILDLPTAYAWMILNMIWPVDSAVKLLKIGGEACTHYPDKVYPFDIWNIYGPTEATVEATYFKMYTANQDPKKLIGTPLIGKILANAETYIVDQYLNPVAQGIEGELLIGGLCLSPGYYNRPDLTNAKFIENPFTKTGFLYRTGDLASYTSSGNINFIGRVDNQIKVRGYRIELGDIENVISKYPDVREVAVIAKENPNGEKSIIAYVVPNLDKERYLYQERCLISTSHDHYIEAISEDLSKYGIAITGINETIPIGQKVNLHIKLPGFNSGKDVAARLIWQIDSRAGFVFDLNPEEQQVINRSIDYFLSVHNIMDLVLSASAKRSIRKALGKKLPEYMVPTSFVTLTEFPHTFSGKIDLKALPPPNDFEQILRKHYVPPRTDTEKRVTAIWSQILHRDNIGMEDNFFDLGGNSLKAAELSVRIMENFNISVPAKILFDLSYVPILSQFIDSRGTEFSTQSYIQEEIDRDLILHEQITPSGYLSEKLKNPENILLTGAAGFLGVFMLNELIKTTNAKIHCLIRKTEFESAAQRLSATIKKFGLEDSLSLANRRIIAVPSDISLSQFGIPSEHYENLAKKVDLIFHCGAQVNIMASYSKLRTSNVQGTHEIIKFATHLQDKPIHYISTLSAAYLRDENNALTEEFPTEQFYDLFGGYAISKWVSERLLTKLKNRGVPITIYRSGYISGDSTTGNTSHNDALLMLIKGCIELGYAPNMHEQVTILPVDFVSKAIVAMALDAGKHSDTYHIDHPTGIMWTDLVAWLNDYGYPIKMISLSEWQNMLHQIPQSNALFPFLPYYLALAPDYRSPPVRTDKAAAELERLNLDYPSINNELLTLYFDNLCRAGFFTAPGLLKV